MAACRGSVVSLITVVMALLAAVCGGVTKSIIHAAPMPARPDLVISGIAFEMPLLAADCATVV